MPLWWVVELIGGAVEKVDDAAAASSDVLCRLALGMLVLKTMLVRHGAETTEVSQGASICVKAWHESPPKEMVVKDAHHVNGLEVLLDASNLLAHSAQALGEVDLERAASTMRFGLAEIDQHEDSDGHSSDGYKYSGILASQSGFSCSLYLVPFNADHVGVFDLASQTLRTVDISVSGEFKYSAGVIYNEVAYFAPYGANHVGIFDLKSEHFGKLAVPSSAECKYSAILSKDSTAYLVPSSSAHVGVLDMARRSFKTISIPDTGIRWKYRGGVLHNGKCYFAPYNADDIGVLDIASEAFHAVDISSTISIDTKFTDAFVRDEVIYFVPFNADGVGALHLESHRFELLQPGNFAAQSFKFWGAIQVGSLTYFVPDNSNAVGVFKADAQEYVEVDISSKISSAFKFATGIFFNGVLYFAPRNAQSIGMLEVGRADRDLCTNRAEAPEAAVAVALPHLSDAADPRSSWDEVWEWPRILEEVDVEDCDVLATGRCGDLLRVARHRAHTSHLVRASWLCSAVLVVEHRSHDDLGAPLLRATRPPGFWCQAVLGTALAGRSFLPGFMVTFPGEPHHAPASAAGRWQET
ncbi:Uncharacterized protein SCF082_LOCUS28561 [Durusdinium trenchii]|uniref:Uncharacterized protein n=1 Tax=Durusdinium trenchii TaxID=1381693 RepID=A0ABP0MKZ8_9DINO